MKTIFLILAIWFVNSAFAQNTLLTGDTLIKSKSLPVKIPPLYSSLSSSSDVPIFRIAEIGDMGENNADQRKVSNLINILQPDIIKTNGDNIYGAVRGNTYDSVIKKYYPNYYKSNIQQNRFFPAIGNHDLDEFPPGQYTEYRYNYAGTFKNYFALPNNERYYSVLTKDFKAGSSIKLISFNSDFGGAKSYCPFWNIIYEPSGIDSNSIQANWLRGEIITSKEKFNLIQLHYPPVFSWSYPYYYGVATNCQGFGPDTISLRIDTLFKKVHWIVNEKNVSFISAGHNHLFEAIGNKLVINGLGGGIKNPDTTAMIWRAPESRKLYTANFGLGLYNEYTDSLQYLFINVNIDTVWRQTIYPLKSVKIKAYFEGYIDRSDTITVFLKSSSTFRPTIDTCRRKLNEKGEAVFWFPNAQYGSKYYLAIRHRGSIETWSSAVVTISDTMQVYDFTTGTNKAAGNNLKVINGTSYLIGGDINQDGVIDSQDMARLENDIHKFSSGYLQSDINGDTVLDAVDMSILDNNLRQYITKIIP